jgi:hypothetical protein
MDAITFLRLGKEVFVQCSCCGQFFRLSDCGLYQDSSSDSSILDGLNGRAPRASESGNSGAPELIADHAAGRVAAQKEVEKLDSVFSPIGLKADDAKPIFHPVDFIVFDGMNTSPAAGVQRLILMDGQKISDSAKRTQESIVQAVHKKRYEWVLLRIDDQGVISELKYDDPDYKDDIRLPSFGPMPESLKPSMRGRQINLGASDHDFRKGLPRRSD